MPYALCPMPYALCPMPQNMGFQDSLIDVLASNQLKTCTYECT